MSDPSPENDWLRKLTDTEVRSNLLWLKRNLVEIKVAKASTKCSIKKYEAELKRREQGE